MSLYLLALLAGIVTGLRTAMALAALSWAAYLSVLPLSGSWLGWLGHWLTPWLLTAAAALELVGDKLPSTPSRKVPPQFGARLVVGALCGAAVGLPAGAWIGGLLAGLVGAAIGTLGGAAARARLAALFGRDLPAALVEDAFAIVAALLLLGILR